MLLTEEGEDPGGRHVEFVGSGKKEHVSNTVGIKLLKWQSVIRRNAFSYLSEIR